MPTKSAAFDALLLGRHLLERRSPETLDSATAAFRQAIQADSGYAPAYAGLSSAYVLHVMYGFPDGREPVRGGRAGDWRWPTTRSSWTPTLAEAYLARADALLISLAPHDAGAPQPA